MDVGHRRTLILTLTVALLAVGILLLGLGSGTPPPPVTFDAQDLETLEPDPTSGDPWGPAAGRVTRQEISTNRVEELALRGRVVGPDGRPVAGAQVQWALFAATGRALRLREPVLTRADGTFAFAGSAPAHPRLVLVARAAGHAPAIVERTLTGTTEGLDLGDLQLLVGGIITGRVVDDSTAPVAGASVSLSPTGGNQLDRIRAWRELLPILETSADGTFRRQHIAPGKYRLVCWAPGKQRHEPQAAVEVVDGDVVDLGDLALVQGHRLTGIVVGPDGEPLANANVRAKNDLSEGRDVRIRAFARSQDDGRFRIDHLPPRKLEIVVTADGCLTWTRRAVDPTSEAELRVELAAGLTLSGRVLDAATGTPVSRFSFLVLPGDPDDPTHAGPLPTMPTGLPVSREHTDGRFAESGLDAGFYYVTVRCDGYAYAQSEIVELRPEASAREVVLRLTRGNTLSGVVVGRNDGTPLAGASVELRLPAGEPEPPTVAIQTGDQRADPISSGSLARTTKTDEQGGFRFANLPPTTLVLVARREGYVPCRSPSLTVQGDRSDLRLELEGPATLHGAIASTRDLRRSAHVIVYGGVDRIHTIRVAPGDDYRIEGLPPGPYLVRACADDPRDYLVSRIRQATNARGEPVIADVTLHGGEERELPLELDRPAYGTITGIARKGGTPVAGCQVSLLLPTIESESQPRFLGRSISTRTAADGTYELHNVPAGQFGLQCVAPRGTGPYAAPPRQVTIAEGQSHYVGFDW